MHTTIIAEAGVNHNGDVSLAKELCHAAKESGADVVKFQAWITDKLITKSVNKASYQEINTADNSSQYDMLKALELSHESFIEIKDYCNRIGITFASTADEIDSLDFLVGIGIPFIKIGSAELCNIPYLRHIGSKGLPIIMSTGMGTLSDIEISLNTLYESGATEISLLHCTTEYPCPYNSVNLNAISTLKNAFNLNVGYSDHTIGGEIAIAAVACGASIIEKHFTLDNGMSGPDHIASMEPGPFKEMVKSIRNVEIAMGNGIKKPSLAEKEISTVVLKRIVATRPIKKDSIITTSDITTKRSSSGLPALYWDIVNGSVANRDYNCDEGIDF